MNKVFGYRNEPPLIELVRFRGDKMDITLKDGRKISMPLDRFPDIQKLTPSQRRKHDTLAGLGLMFDDIDLVYHVSEFTGIRETSIEDIASPKQKDVHSMVVEPQARYKRNQR